MKSHADDQGNSLVKSQVRDSGRVAARVVGICVVWEESMLGCSAVH